MSPESMTWACGKLWLNGLLQQATPLRLTDRSDEITIGEEQGTRDTRQPCHLHLLLKVSIQPLTFMASVSSGCGQKVRVS